MRLERLAASNLRKLVGTPRAPDRRTIRLASLAEDADMGMLDDFKQQNPDYAGVDNNTLADALYAKYYSQNMPRADYDAKLGLAQPQANQADPSFWQRATQSL